MSEKEVSNEADPVWMIVIIAIFIALMMKPKRIDLLELIGETLALLIS